MTPDRRRLVAGAAAALLLPERSRAAPADFAIDWQGGPETPAVAESLRQQIALVRALPIDPDIARFFATQPIAVDL